MFISLQHYALKRELLHYNTGNELINPERAFYQIIFITAGAHVHLVFHAFKLP
jgi:hypothetical protein